MFSLFGVIEVRDSLSHSRPRTMIRSGRGSAPPDSRVWKTLELKPPELQVDDSKTCFRGDEWGNCNAQFYKPTCKWWHFPAEANEEDMWNVFQRISKEC